MPLLCPMDMPYILLLAEDGTWGRMGQTCPQVVAADVSKRTSVSQYSLTGTKSPFWRQEEGSSVRRVEANTYNDLPARNVRCGTGETLYFFLIWIT
jgi:hypothetical protein